MERHRGRHDLGLLRRSSSRGCTYIVKRGPNVWSKPHFHDSDRFVTVLEGTLWVGTGKFDPQRTVPLKAGSFVRDVAGGIHFEGTKDDGATLYFIGIGPSPSRRRPSRPPPDREPT